MPSEQFAEVSMEAVNLRQDRQNLGGVFAVAVCVGAITGVWHSLIPLFSEWNKQEYSHAWFILPLAVLIFIQRFRTVQPGDSGAPGVLIAILSVAIMMFAWATASFTLSIYGAILGLIGFVWSSVGTQAMKTLAAPMVYLLFMVPPPLALYMSLSAEMQLLSSELGMFLISLFPVSAYLDGNVIVLASARLEVAEACNGLRYLFPLVSFAFLISMLVEDRFWKKVIVVLSSVPIAIVMNAGRIAMIAVLLERFGIDTSIGSAHTFAGFAVFSLCIVVLFLEVWCLLAVGSARGRLLVSDLLTLDRDTSRRLISWPVSRTSILAGTILLVGTGVVASLSGLRAEVIPQRQPLALFPMEFKGWRGVPHTLDRELADSMGFTDYLLADFANETGIGGSLNFYIAYYASQHAGIHPHSPQLCIPGGGWTIINQSVIALPLTRGGSFDANRVVIEKQGVKEIVYYWFEERGRHIAREDSLRYYALRDALIDNRTDGALMRIVAPIYAGDEATADSMARNLLADAGAFIQTYVPGEISR
jgi:exosortase D (VPLPA-CTERM-specific)